MPSISDGVRQPPLLNKLYVISENLVIGVGLVDQFRKTCQLLSDNIGLRYLFVVCVNRLVLLCIFVPGSCWMLAGYFN